MNFVSWEFLMLVFPIMVLRLTLGRRRTEPIFLWSVALASTIFVAWHVPAYIFIMLTSILVDYWAAVGILRWGSRHRNLLLAASLSTNLALLGFFKYTNFFLQVTEDLATSLGADIHLSRLDLVLPMGISFYTFCSMSYTIDVYRGRIQPTRSFFDFYYFITFFPHLVAGPIIRAEQFIYQFYRVRRPHLRVLNAGLYFIVRGLFLKMVCADNLGNYLKGMWQASYFEGAPCLRTWIVVLMFSCQIFYDFEGYTSIARGLAYLLGFRFPINFNNPYLAGSFRNFWERWHITLSSWLRDYLYVPLGGNRQTGFRTNLNLMTVMLLGGLWHGAAPTFLAWGFVHGLGLAVERALGLQRGQNYPRVVRILWYLVVQFTVLLTWVIFRSDTLRGAFEVVTNLLSFRGYGLVASDYGMLWLLLPILSMHLHGFAVEKKWVHPLGNWGKACLVGLMGYVILTAYGGNNDFIYFAF